MEEENVLAAENATGKAAEPAAKHAAKHAAADLALGQQPTQPSKLPELKEPQQPPAGPMILAINVAGDQVGSGLGRAHTMAVAVIANGRITDWDEQEVGWDISHDQAGEGHHHATIVRFMQDHHIQVAVSGHMGPPMADTLKKLGVVPLVGAEGPAKDAALAAAALVQEQALQQAPNQASQQDTLQGIDDTESHSPSE